MHTEALPFPEKMQCMPRHVQNCCNVFRYNKNKLPDGAGLGKNNSPDNLINVSSLLYMYTVLPGFAAISYMPGLVLERPLYIR